MSLSSRRNDFLMFIGQLQISLWFNLSTHHNYYSFSGWWPWLLNFLILKFTVIFPFKFMMWKIKHWIEHFTSLVHIWIEIKKNLNIDYEYVFYLRMNIRCLLMKNIFGDDFFRKIILWIFCVASSTCENISTVKLKIILIKYFKNFLFIFFYGRVILKQNQFF